MLCNTLALCKIVKKMVDQLVILAETEPAPHLMRGIQVFKIMVPCLRRDGVWIPVFMGMTEKLNP
jgi:hypothetical protein